MHSLLHSSLYYIVPFELWFHADSISCRKMANKFMIGWMEEADDVLSESFLCQ
jgi:hypothetical protein